MDSILGLSWDWIILILILFGYFGYMIYRYIVTRRVISSLSEKEFKKGYRKAQLIDVRNQKDYDAGYIVGARNIPLSHIKQRMNELRKDLPVYLYCQSGTSSYRAAWLLHKAEFEDINILEDGFKKWDGKVKKVEKPNY